VRYWILLLLPLVFTACQDKVTGSGGDGNGNNPDAPTATILALRTGNWWDYQVSSDTASSPYMMRRSVRNLRVIGNAGFYPITDSLFAGGHVDTLYYLRGVHDVGIICLPYPADSAQPDTLFAYPHVHSGNHYRFGADSIEVLYDPPGAHNVPIGDSLYTVMAYQRFFGGAADSSIRYDLNADSTGILRERRTGLQGYTATLTNYHLAP